MISGFSDWNFIRISDIFQNYYLVQTCPNLSKLAQTFLFKREKAKDGTFFGTFFGHFYFFKNLFWDLFWDHFLYYFQEGEGKADDRMGGDGDIPSISAMNSLDSPMTPCPSAVEYVTPVFAKNYQGVWRYVVQIPYEGYFTQTVEVVKCL